MNHSGDRKYWEKEAKRLHSLWIRQRDADKNGIITCCTSGDKVNWRYSDCGHFVHRRHMSVYFDERNCHAQSINANRFNSGEEDKYRIFIDKKYGSGTADELIQLSRSITKYSWHDFAQLADHYKKKLIEHGYSTK